MIRQVIFGVAIVVLGAVAWSFFNTAPAGLHGAALLPGSANAQEAAAEDIDISTITEMQMGNPDAAVTVIEYASFTCPHCAAFHETTFKKLKAEYIDTGKINFIYRDVYFDRYGLWAAAIARCAGPEKFFGISDLIYSGQSSWVRAGGGDPGAIVEELRKIGRLAGLDNEQLESCLQDGTKLKTLVAWYQQNAERDGIRSTPSLIINGKQHKNMPYGELKEVIDAALDAS